MRSAISSRCLYRLLHAAATPDGFYTAPAAAERQVPGAGSQGERDDTARPPRKGERRALRAKVSREPLRPSVAMASQTPMMTAIKRKLKKRVATRC